MNIKVRNVIIFFFLIFFSVPWLFAGEKSGNSKLPELLVFFSPSCQKCIEVKAKVMPKIEKNFGKQLRIEYRDISDIQNYVYLLSLKEKYKSDIKMTWPVFFFEGRFLNGEGDVGVNLTTLIYLTKPSTATAGSLPRVGLLDIFRRFKVLGIVVAGLEDGINPCAFTVIVFFISFLALQGYRRKELALIGAAFILSVFTTYLLIGLGIFNFLYSLKGFHNVTKGLNVSIGSLSVILGGLALYDYYRFKKSGETEGLILQLPKPVKERIHKIVGLHYRKTQEEKEGATQPHIFKLVASAVITGFLVCLLEAVCTGQLYLPTIAFVFKTTDLKMQAFTYLLLYNLMFVLPLVVIFLLALLGVTSGQFANFMKKHLGSIKLSMAGLFLILGFILLWRL